ncbi:thiamine transporter substrate binding subunit [Psychromonas sp. CNPT3]|uniref:thiamine ABC transporter substrate binding subunit n=1 Tax=Psychromonas sp. CNPT3 TaxID=314282 RepID=UPI00006E98F3|nr:thiamine ABC transporter substrate binding subunit [Psychromonas sp. CNPT3]AGH81152.1 thiamine transporter substrate binding subunit [Psychromonas sp. CNPT3]
MQKNIILLALSALFIQPTWAENAPLEKLTVYTYNSFTSDWGPGPKIEKAFEESCNCDLDFVSLDDGISVLNRLRLEGNNSRADIILGLDDSLMADAEKTGLLAKHNMDLTNIKTANKWTDLTFVPYDQGYFAFVYNKDKLKNPPKSLKELVERKDDLKIIYQDPRTSTPGLGLLLWMKSVYGDSVSRAWKQLDKKTVTVTKGWTESYSMFLKGEADMVLSYTTSPAYHIIVEGKNQYVAADFSEGHYMQTEVAAIVKSSQHKKLAEKFMHFMLSDEFQGEIATGNWMYPVTDVALPEQFRQLTVPSKALSIKSEDVSTHRRAWTREWLNALTD